MTQILLRHKMFSVRGKVGFRLPFWQIDRVLLAVGILSVVLSMASLLVVQQQQLSLAYYDAQARLLITRRVVDSPTPGLAQLGSVWLPLTHILALPLIGSDLLYQTGLALTAISMFFFVVLTLYTYQTVRWLTGQKSLGFTAVLILFTNPNLLYLQATPMTEVPMLATMMMSIYYLVRLSAEPENRTWLFLSGFSLALSCLIRYEGWMLLSVSALALIYIFVRSRFSYTKIEGLLIFWGYWAFIGIAAWVAWNWMIFGDPLAFQRGEYAKPSLWVAADDPIIGSWSGAFHTYALGTLSIVGPLFLVGLLGALFYSLRTRLQPSRVMPLILFALFPFFVMMLYAGQRPMKVPEVSGEMYNIRFALVMLLPTAVFVPELARSRRWLIGVIMAAAAASLLFQVWTHGVITVKEPEGFQATPGSQKIAEAAAWLKANYDGGTILIESYGNDQLQFGSGIPLGKVIYEGSYGLWEPALNLQISPIDWIIMRRPPADANDLVGPDKVWLRWNGQPELEERFALVYSSDLYLIYRTRQ